MGNDDEKIQRLRRLGARHRRLRHDLAGVVDEMHPLIIELAREGVPQVELVEATGYTRDRIRVICRQAGVEALPPGRPPRRP